MSGVNFTFGPFAFDLDRQLLLKHGCPVVLGQRGAALLGALLKANGMPVTKSELMDAAWPDLHVEESNLSVQIASLRKTLGKAPSDNDWIETMQRSGYKFVGATEAARPSPVLSLPQKSSSATLAILPFANLCSDPEQGYFASGLTEDLIAILAKVPGLAVTARHSSFYFQNTDPNIAAAKLGVRYVASGSVRRSGDLLRVSVQLTDMDIAVILWSERLDRSVGNAHDLFSLQDEVAQKIAMLVYDTVAPVHILKRYRTGNLEAYELTVKARRLGYESLSANRQADASYRRAISLDPNYPEPHWQLAQTLIH